MVTIFILMAWQKNSEEWQMEAHFLLGNFGWKFWTTLQDVSIISEISRLVGAKLSYHSLSDRNFWYFDADDKYGLLVLTKLVRSIWLDIAFFFACLWTWTKSRSIQYAKKKTVWPISSHLDWTSLVNKGFIIWDKTPTQDKFSLR